jgi:hypothetical protein
MSLTPITQTESFICSCMQFDLTECQICYILLIRFRMLSLKNVPSLFSFASKVSFQAISNAVKGTTREELLINHVFQTATEGNPDSVLKSIDEFGWKKQFLMVMSDGMRV